MKLIKSVEELFYTNWFFNTHTSEEYFILLLVLYFTTCLKYFYVVCL